MKKKFGAILMAGVMSLSMAASLVFTTGCFNNAQIVDFQMPENGFDINADVEIKFWHTMGQDLSKVLNTYIGEFNKLYPHVTITEEQVGSYDDVRNLITKRITAGTQPNIAYCYPDHVALFNESGAVQPLNDFLPGSAYGDVKITRADNSEEYFCLTSEEKDKFMETYYNEGFQFDDGDIMYTFPFAKSTEVLYYNENWFNAHPEVKIPTTWDELETACAQIKEIDSKLTPFTYDSESNWFITLCEQYGSPYTAIGETAEESFLFDNPTNREFLTRIKSWWDKGYFTTQAFFGSYTSDMFKKQESVMCIGSSAGAKNQNPDRVDGEYPFSVGVVGIPQVHPENPKAILQGPSVCIFKQQDPQKVMASWLFVKYLTTNVNFQAAFSGVSGYIPVLNMTTMEENTIYKDNLAKANGNTYLTYKTVQVALEQESAYFTSPAFNGSSTARDQVGLMLQAVMTGTSLDQAFQDAIAKCKAAFI